MNMLGLLIVFTAFAFLYGFVWHDKPAQGRDGEKHNLPSRNR
jgi:hypothetical protein